MFIKRVQVEEGFLDGLDVELSSGLNVIIGARGTGKTSLIELIKFCLGVKGHSPESSKRSRDHALSVLGAGQVTVTIADGAREVVVSRTALDATARATGEFNTPIVFSQTEIESIGLQSGGRLNLLTSFVDVAGDGLLESNSVAEARSLTAQAGVLRREYEELQGQLNQIPTLNAELTTHAPAEQDLSKISAAAKQRKQELDSITAEISKQSVASSILQRLTENLERWQSSIELSVQEVPKPEYWSEASGPDPLVNINIKLNTAQEFLQKALAQVTDAEREIADLSKSHTLSKLQKEDRARQFRKDLDVLQAGAGTIARQGQVLREKIAQLEALRALQSQKIAGLNSLMEKRGLVLDRIEKFRETRYHARAQIAIYLNKALAPRIRITVTRAGQFETFSASIADALKRSGLKYGDLAPALAKTISPRELLEAAESDDVEFISESSGISVDRATRLLSHLRDSDLGALGTSPVEDLVDFQLLDGTDYKDISELSTGQRCTVVLPIVLRHTKSMLIVDQPEDHIDNAFIADTLIKSVLARDPNSQIIFSSHNANIPVLGDANRIIQMGSDGRRGFVLTAADLGTPKVVNAITTVMEGGLQAFEYRHDFYERHKK